jgi:hypothetical protein
MSYEADDEGRIQGWTLKGLLDGNPVWVLLGFGV